MQNEHQLLQRLSQTVAQVLELYAGAADLTVMVNSAWTARDVLVHILFWHESFARNVSALARGSKPVPVRGTYAALARTAADAARDVETGALLDRLAHAQRTIEQCIFDPKVVSIPYKSGSRPYAPAEHLMVVNDHVAGHLATVRAAMVSRSGIIAARDHPANGSLLRSAD